MSGWGDRPQERVEQRIQIDADGHVTAFSGKVEFGQGIRTAFAQVVADELDVPIENVEVILGDTDRVPYDMGTFGSRSVAQEAPALRRAAAFARGLRKAGKPIEGIVPDDVPLRPESERRYLGQPIERHEARDIVSGRGKFTADVRLANMAYGAIVRPPVRGAKVKSVDDAAARGMPGVVAVVRHGDLVGVVATREEQAATAAAAVEIDWEIGRPPEAERIEISMRDDGDVDRAIGSGKTRLEAAYTLPPISNAPIGPSASLADVRDDSATIFAGTQRPFGLRTQIAGALGLGEERVRVIPTMPSGTYGRNSQADAPLEAALLSKHARRPVLVQWTRGEEFALGPSRPEAYLEVAASLDQSGHIAAWRYDEHTNVHGAGTDPRVLPVTSGRNAIPPYRIPKARVTLFIEPTPLRTASFRSLAAAENVFAIESFMDELAARAGQDPLAFRLAHVDDPRLRRVFEHVAAASGLGRAAGERRGLGIAGTVYHGTYIAEVAEVVVDTAGRVRLVRVWAAVDPGLTLNPDGVRNQTEGGIVQSASWTLFEAVHHRDGRISNTSWDTYPIATFADAPESIDVDVIGDPSQASTGVGEPGAVCISAAIANAVFAATGIRVRELPMTPARLRA